MNYGWYDAPTKVDVRHYLGVSDPAAVFEVGAYQVTLKGFTSENPPQITYTRDRRYRSSDPRQTFPNMSVNDGVMTIPVEDIVSEILSRLEPETIALALWSASDEVRKSFMECMTGRYTDGSIPDAERRDFLKGVKEAVHNEAIDRLATRIFDAEFKLCEQVTLWQRIDAANNTLRALEDRLQTSSQEPIKLPRIENLHNDTLTRIGGQAWTEGREYWRAKVSEAFPAPSEVGEG